MTSVPDQPLAAPTPPPQDDFKRRRRKLVKTVAFSLREALKVDEVSDHVIEEAIALLQSVQRLEDQTSNGAKKQIFTHRRSASDPNVPLTIWMKLRHSNKPQFGYRVQCPDARSTVTPLGAIDASSFLPNVSRGVSDTRLRGLVMDHLSCSSEGSPFISIFTDEKRAERFALEWGEDDDGQGCELLTLDPSKITRLFSVAELAQQLGFRTSNLPEEDEWLVVHQIPADAIVKRRKTRPRVRVEEGIPGQLSGEVEEFIPGGDTMPVIFEGGQEEPGRKDSAFPHDLPPRMDSLSLEREVVPGMDSEGYPDDGLQEESRQARHEHDREVLLRGEASGTAQ